MVERTMGIAGDEGEPLLLFATTQALLPIDIGSG